MDTKKSIAIGWFIGIVSSFFLLFLFSKIFLPVPQTKVEVSEEAVFTVINDYRTSVGKIRFKKSERLCDWGKIRLYEVKRDWSHNGFDPERVCILEGCHLGEVLTRDIESANEAVEAWLNSKTHKEILDWDFEWGCIIAEDGYVVGEFGTFWK